MDVSCIVSVYNGGSFIYGCLNDLVKQTLYQQGVVEIVIIDSASPDSEAEIIKRFQNDFPHIHYVRTTERETLYAAWNRGVSLSKGRYLTNANADDRHREDALEVMFGALEKNPSVDLVYGDVYRSVIANEMFQEIKNPTILQYSEFCFSDVILHCQFGCQPMWRKSLHDSVGGFDPSMKAAGDWEFNFRFNLAAKQALHIESPLGVFYENPKSVSVVGNASAIEQAQVRQKYVTFENVLKLLSLDGWKIETPAEQAVAFSALATRALQIKLPWEADGIFTDLGLAQSLFSIAVQLDPQNATAIAGLQQCEHLKR